MPSIIPDPGSPPAVAPIGSPIQLSGNSTYTIDAGTQVYAVGIDRVFQGWDDSITNNGTVWLENDGVFAWFIGGNRPQISNNGLIYLHGNNIVELSSKADHLVNTGSIFSISDSGTARVINSEVYPVYVENSGLIAAQSLGIDDTPDPVYVDSWNAITIDANGYLQLINHARGQILAEAPDLAIAISGPGGDPTLGTTFVTNAGLIEANATGPDGISIGIYLSQPSYVPLAIDNSGIIRADLAIYASYQYGNFTGYGIPNPVEHLNNQVGGVIEGQVFLDIGDDQFVNNGSVIGDVDMGAGSDVFSGSGSVSGVVDMGFDDDSYTGSAGSDRAAGGRGDDALLGGDGGDLLLGGFGNDTLQGDAGNDGLFGEWGDDVINTSGGDYVEGGEDNDRIEVGDYTFSWVDGGDGIDTLVLAAGVRKMDLTAALATGRIANFETIELTGSKELVVRSIDVASITGGGSQIIIDATATDKVDLLGTWTQGTNQVIGGTTYKAFTSNGVTVLVEQVATVQVGSSAPAGAIGLDAIAAGEAAPLPGAASGVDYTEPAHFLNQFFLFTGEEFTVDSREIFYSDGEPVFYSISSELIFTNNGQIYSLDDAFPSAIGLEFRGRTTVVNNGLIHVEELAPLGSVVYYPSFGVKMGGAPDTVVLENYGEISVYSVPNSAIGVNAVGVFRNEGLISAISENSRAIGVNAVYASHIDSNSQTFFNTGVIYAEAGGVGGQSYIMGDYTVPTIYAATGVAAFGTVTNDGGIFAMLRPNADPDLTTVGVYVLNHYANSAHPAGVVNNGTIEGTIAIKFEENYDYNHWVTNNGLILGNVEFENGNDQYDGSNGEMQGTVFGFGGNDTFLGGSSADSFDGGDGNDRLTGNGGDDILKGGAGVDKLTGGAGNDTFFDTAAGLNGDTITDLRDGDSIVIADADLASFSFSLSGSTLAFTGGSLTLTGIASGQFAASAASGGGVQLTVVQITPTLAVPLSAGDFNGDGRSDILWRNDDGRITDWLGTASGGFAPNAANSLNGVATDWHVAGIGDFNADGRDDILWRNNDGRMSDWLGTASGGFADNAAHAYNSVATDWHIAGTGDFNGDGRDDILWRHDDGRITDWLGTANGGFSPNSANALDSVSLDWSIAAVGDFNGDGRDDILWRNADGRITDWLGTATGAFGSNAANAYTSVATDWHIIGAGDFNGDGRDDILWRNNDGRITDWLGTANGGFAPNAANSFNGVATDWHVASIGDFNGDGRDDILWRHDDGRMTDWLGTANGGLADNAVNAYNSVATDWHVQAGDIFWV
jgi:hypothetical protein